MLEPVSRDIAHGLSDKCPQALVLVPRRISLTPCSIFALKHLLLSLPQALDLCCNVGEGIGT
jgi:hypothetical protein